MELGRVGIWTSVLGMSPDRDVRRLVPQIESLGYRTIWYPETFAKEALTQAALLLRAGREVVAATGIAQIWARDATAAINGARTLHEAYPDRFLLGIGVSHAPTVDTRGHDYRRPVASMRAYLDAMEAATYIGPTPPSDPPVVLAALGPVMLRLAAERTAGAHPYFVPVEHTSFARRELGEGTWLLPEQAVVVSEDPTEARRIARLHAKRYLALDNYRRNLLRLGWSEDDLAGEGSDPVIDAVVAWGTVDAIQARVAAHLEAGADHVCIQVLGPDPRAFPLEDLRRITPAMMEL